MQQAHQKKKKKLYKLRDYANGQDAGRILPTFALEQV